MTKPKKIWVSRDDNYHSKYDLWTTRPKKYRDFFLPSGDRSRILRNFCPEEFEGITGTELEPGECKRFEIHLKEV